MNNSNTAWFRKKQIGWGWTPNNAKGWAVTIVFMLSAMVYPALTFPDPAFNPVYFLLINFVLMFIFFGVCQKMSRP